MKKSKLLRAMLSGMLATTCAMSAFVNTSCGGFEPTAEIVNKDGADAVVTFVIDDGNHPTATFSKEMMEKYENLTFTYALWTKDFGTLTLTADGTEYLMEDGRYVYTQNDTQIANQVFWWDILKNGRCEAVSHTHTHQFWGTNDDGGEFEYVKNNEEKVSTATMPKGSVTKELYGSMQILQDVFPQNRFPNQRYVSLVLPGIGVRTTDFKTADGKNITTYLTYFNSLLTKSVQRDEYIGARSTFQVTDTASSASKVVLPESLRSVKSRMSVPAYMIVDSNKGANGVENWTAFIDHAVEKGGWACYCIHNILTTASGHYILQDDAEKLFAHTYGKNIWVATFTDALMYYSQWSTAKVETSYSGGKVSVTVKDSENDEVFNAPLTVKVTVPSKWTSATCDGETLEIRSDENGNKYVYVNIVPDSGAVEIAQG